MIDELQTATKSIIYPFVIVIAGPTGIGKTTLSKILTSSYKRYDLIS